MRQYAVGGGNSELITSAATALRTKRYWTAAAAIVYLAILIARVWGAHRFLHFEESAMVGASRSLPLSAIWDDHAYGKFLQWVLIEVSSLIDISYLPSVLVALAVFVWLISAIGTFVTMMNSGISAFSAFCGSLVLCLVPLPDLAMMGLISSTGFPIAVLLIAICSVSERSINSRSFVFELVILFVIAASTPTGLVGAGVLAFLWLINYGSRRTNLLRVSAIFAGTAISAVVVRFQEPLWAYLGVWVPTSKADRLVLDRLTEAGAFITRERASVGIVDTIRNIPGTLRFIVTQFYPEPWASRAILETGGVAKLLQVVLPLALVIAIVAILARMRSHKIDSSVMRAALGLFLAAAMSVIVQHVLVGQLTLRQYLFLPLAFFWMAILVLFSGAVVARSGRAIVLLSPLLFVFVFAASQNFRDPFQENPRQGGIGRYASEDLWRPALEKARVACESLEEDEVVVVSQFDPESPVIKQMIKTSGLKFAWFDHPFVARCYVINGG